MKYSASWSANSGSTYGSFDGNNLRTIIRDAREIAKGNTFDGNHGTVTVRNTVTDRIVYEGTV